MKSILFITAFPPNSKTAGQNYTKLLLEDLARHGYSVDLLYFAFPNHTLEVGEGVKVLKEFFPSKKNILFHPFLYPLFSKRYDKEVLHYINSIASNYDILYFDFSQVHIYSKFITHPFKILMCHDVIYQKTKRQFPIFLLWEKHTERSILKSAKMILTFSQKDSDLIRVVYGLKALPVNFYLKDSILEKLPETERNAFCFYGAWNRKENYEALLWFIKNVLPKVSRELQFKVIGGGMNEKVQKKISLMNNFEYMGFIDNPISEIANCQALIAPLLHGAGVKVKVIDALSSGTKVIGTEIAFEGISDNKNYPLFIRCQTRNDFVAVLNNWHTDFSERKLHAAKEFFCRYDKNHLLELLEKTISEASSC